MWKKKKKIKIKLILLNQAAIFIQNVLFSLEFGMEILSQETINVHFVETY